MQGPRLPSHGAESLITAFKPEERVRRPSYDESDKVERLPDKSNEQLGRDREPRSKKSRLKTWGAWCKRHIYFLGPGLIASAAYIDPGNYATDLQAGASYGYKLLFIVLFSGMIGIFGQILSARLGIVTGKDMSALCRESLHSRKKYTMFWRWGVLYPLYFICESAIIFTDLAELLGTATAFNLLVPKIPLWGGVLLTSLDVFVVLIAFSTYPSEKRNRSIVAFEMLIAALVITVMASFVALLVRLKPDWPNVFEGYLPSHSIIADGALYVSVGIVGATVMPHALILGSKLGTIERVDEAMVDDRSTPSGEESYELPSWPTPRSRTSNFAPSLHMPHPTPMPSLPLNSPSGPVKQRSLKSIRVHIHHATIDIAVSLFAFAMLVNSAILIVASAAFYYGSGGQDTTEVQDGNLFSAFSLIKGTIGNAFAYLFALALLFSGLAASITATLAGQVVSEGFIEWRTTPWKRRLITRMIGMVPSLAVSASVGESGVNTLLVASQVTLSLCLPFVLFPILVFTSSQSRMSAVDPDQPTSENRPKESKIAHYANMCNPFASRQPASTGLVSFANNHFTMGLGWSIYILIVIADVYAMVQLGQG